MSLSPPSGAQGHPPGPGASRAATAPGGPRSTAATTPRRPTVPPGPGTGPASAAAGAGPTAAGTKPDRRQGGAGDRRGGTRRARLTVSRVDPWSVLKLSFLLSVGIGIAIVVAAFVLWSVLDGMGLFTQVDSLARDVVGDESPVELESVLGLGRVLSLATVVAVVDVVLLTALATLGAVLYNLASSLVGGLQVTLSDD